MVRVGLQRLEKKWKSVIFLILCYSFNQEARCCDSGVWIRPKFIPEEALRIR